MTHESVGVVLRIDDDGEMIIDFPEQSGWLGVLSEMELVDSVTPVEGRENGNLSNIFINNYVGAVL